VTPQALTVGTRGSALALTQTESVVALLRAAHPDVEIEVRRITTKGDAMHDVPLSALGGRGVFVDAIEDALRRREIDLAVHSAKDMPSVVPADLEIAAFLERADPRDVLVSRGGGLHDLPPGARLGTSSPRRVSLIHAARPDLETVDLRGNVDTRLRKLDDGACDAIVLAAAGLLRLGAAARITEWLPADSFIPSPGQGALGIEIRAHDPEVRDLLRPLAHAPTEIALTAERAFLTRLGVGCAAAVGAHAAASRDGRVTLRAMIGTLDGRSVRGVREGMALEAAQMGLTLADELLDRGGQALVAESERGSVV
jgi:hydroxymethylbilane synthase